MQEIITLIIFTVPGLVTYFWVNLFGITPTTRRNNSEVTAISILLWIPIICVVLAIYNLFALISRWKALHSDIDIPIIKKEWRYVDNLGDLISLSGNIWFLLFYALLTVIVSFYLAKFISKNLYRKMIDQVNNTRKKNNIAPLDAHSTVWDATFLNNTIQIVEYKRMGEEESLKGCLKRVPRAHEDVKAIVLEDVEHWTDVMEYYYVEIKHTYVDIDKGYVLNVYDLDSAREADSIFKKRFPDGTTS